MKEVSGWRPAASVLSASDADLFRRAALSTVFKGAKPDLPVEQPTKFEFCDQSGATKGDRCDDSAVILYPGGQGDWGERSEASRQ
jgi:hypothetical protein